MRTHVDAARCQGHGRCYEWYPDLFLEGPNGHARAVRVELNEDTTTDAETAIGMCPEAAISLEPD